MVAWDAGADGLGLEGVDGVDNRYQDGGKSNAAQD